MEYSFDVIGPKVNYSARILLWVGVLTTLAINPWFAYDPINLPKMLVMSTGAAFLFGSLAFGIKTSLRDKFFINAISILFLIALAISFLSNSAPWYQQLWGTWGRSTGLITYFSFVVIMLASANLASTELLSLTRIFFERLGYFTTLYTLIQLMDLDPISWSQKLMVATLGNINFMSSFLGLATISYFSRILLENLSTSAKIYFTLISMLNAYLVLVSESIQGIAVFLTGAALLISLFIRQRFNFLKSMILFSFLLVLGLLILIGTAGIGPLLALRQETVIFRMDYWGAGLRMLAANPINGIGIDSYGDYYRQYRDFEAVIRTGPQRVTNTAHNIFIDVFSNSGAVAGCLFFLILIIAFVSLLKGLKNQFINADFKAIGAMWFGFLTFCLISINQIGIGFWGFVFTGLLNGYANRPGEEILSDKYSSSQGKPYRRTARVLGRHATNVKNSDVFKLNYYQVAVSSLLGIAMFLMSLVPNVVDARFISAFRSQNLDLAIRLINYPGSQDFHTEQLINKLAQAGRNQESLALAISLSQRNPQNWQAWVFIISNPVSTRNQQIDAAENLFRLDPKNELVRDEVNAFLNP